MCALLRQEKFRYNYGRKWRIEPLRATVLRLPVTSGGDVDWDWIEAFMSSLPYSSSVPVAARSSPT